MGFFETASFMTKLFFIAGSGLLGVFTVLVLLYLCITGLKQIFKSEIVDAPDA